MSACTIRFAVDCDRAVIGAIELSAGELFAGTHMAWAVGETTDHGVLRAAMARGDLLVAEIDGERAGFLLADRLDGLPYIAEMAVARRFHGRRIGQALIAAVVARARDAGAIGVTLTTDRSLPWNAPYYARLGFRTLAAGETGPDLAARLAAEPSPGWRCAMRLDL